METVQRRSWMVDWKGSGYLIVQLFIRKIDYPVFKQLFIQDINLIVLCMYTLLDCYLFMCLIYE